MSAELRRLVQQFAGMSVVVVGDSVLDRFLQGEATTLCREAPVPRVHVSEHDAMPGAAANVALNAAGLGARVRLCTVLGDDEPGDAVVELLTRAGVDTSLVVRAPSRRTLVFHRLGAGSQLLARFDEGDATPVPDHVAATVQRHVRLAAPDADVLIASDYGYGFFTQEIRSCFESLGHPAFVVDAKQLGAWRDAHPTMVKPNWHEALQLLREPDCVGAARSDWVMAHREDLLRVTGAQIVAVTLDHDGAVVLDRHGPPHRTYAVPSPDRRSTGAGDTFLTAFALALASRSDAALACETAAAAAQVVVGKQHTAGCTAGELMAALGHDDKLLDRESLRAVVHAHRAAGRRVVYTNGCFDILHRGHVSLLNRAKALGDVLVVGVNDDAGVRRLKGSDRPINGIDDRVGVLAALSCIDHLVVFDETTSEALLAEIRPDVYAKGGDYSPDALPEASVVNRLGIDLQLLSLIDHRSTTRTIDDIRSRRAVPVAG